MKFFFAVVLVSVSAITYGKIPKNSAAVLANSRFSESKLKRDESYVAIASTKGQKSSALKTLTPILAASFCAAAIMYPLDLVRALQMANAGTKQTTLQLLTNFKNSHGWAGFFTQGLVPELARATWMRFVKFGLFPIIHMGITGGIPESKGNSKTKAISAILTSFPEVMSIMPLEIAKIALQLDAEKLYRNNMFVAIGSIFQKQGLLPLFTAGYLGVQYRQAAWSSAYFVSLPMFEKLVNDGFRRLGVDASSSASAKSTSQLLSGFLAGVFGALLNCPGDTIRTVVQKRIISQSPSVTTFLGVGQEIVGSRGIGALYSGIGFKAIHLGGGGALMAFFVPFFKKLFNV